MNDRIDLVSCPDIPNDLKVGDVFETNGTKYVVIAISGENIKCEEKPTSNRYCEITDCSDNDCYYCKWETCFECPRWAKCTTTPKDFFNLKTLPQEITYEQAEVGKTIEICGVKFLVVGVVGDFIKVEEKKPNSAK